MMDFTNIGFWVIVIPLAVGGFYAARALFHEDRITKDGTVQAMSKSKRLALISSVVLTVGGIVGAVTSAIKDQQDAEDVDQMKCSLNGGMERMEVLLDRMTAMQTDLDRQQATLDSSKAETFARLEQTKAGIDNLYGAVETATGRLHAGIQQLIFPINDAKIRFTLTFSRTECTDALLALAKARDIQAATGASGQQQSVHEWLTSEEVSPHTSFLFDKWLTVDWTKGGHGKGKSISYWNRRTLEPADVVGVDYYRDTLWVDYLLPVKMNLGYGMKGEYVSIETLKGMGVTARVSACGGSEVCQQSLCERRLRMSIQFGNGNDLFLPDATELLAEGPNRIWRYRPIEDPMALLSPHGTFRSGMWTGVRNSDWFDCRNWDDAVVATATAPVVIDPPPASTQ